MDTQTATYETKELHKELRVTWDKQDKRDGRAAKLAGYGATTGGMHLTRTYLKPVTEAVVAKLSERDHVLSKESELQYVLKSLDPEVLALCILQHGLHSVAQRTQLVRACVNIGLAINRELWAKGLLDTDRKLARKVTKAAKANRGRVDSRFRYAKDLAATNGYRAKTWARPDIVRAGNWACNILCTALPNIFVRVDVDGGMKELHIDVTHEAVAMAQEAVTQAVLQNPTYQPRAEKPADWASFNMRIAEDPRVGTGATLLRTHHKDLMSAAAHAINSGQMQPALDGINTLQSVPWKINGWMLSVIQRCWDLNLGVPGLPMKDLIALPERMGREEFNKLPVGERSLFARQRRTIEAVNRGAVSDAILFREDMGIAGNMLDRPCFYVPMNCDWRGRVYGLSHFNFQREDRVRALFMFANGAPIGDEGIEWLKVHVANCGDFDKISKRPIKERIEWTNANIETLTEYVNSPFAHMGWTKADKPFLFLAACRELVRAITTGPTYVCTLPVSFDGSCSGLQHLCAMTRAPEGQLVNLTNNEVPADVYQTVADKAKERIEQESELPELAKLCLSYGVNRSLVKRNVMTFSYSSKEFGMHQQHLEDTMEPLKLKVLKGELDDHPFGDDEGYTASKYLAKHVYATIKDVVKMPAEAMGFMQSLARALAHEGKPLRWTSPAGIPWINRYHDKTTERVELWLNDNGVKSKYRMTVATGEEKPIAKDKVSAGVAPNLVHACDAAHLLLTVRACASEGITNIATVHDSFGCLPSQATRLNQLLREQFLKMYAEHDVLAELRASALADLTPANWDKVPRLPEKGALNLEEVLNAKYAFA